MRTAAIAVLLTAIFLPQKAFADCGHAGVTVVGSPSERAFACRALHGVLSFFTKLGLPLRPRVTITLRDAVFIDVGSHEPSQPPVLIPVSGLFDAGRRTIEITAPTSAHGGGRRPWGIAWTPELAFSILQHELAHMASAEVIGLRWHRVDTAWREYLAYAIQFELMPPELQTRILAAYPGARPFDDIYNINMMLLYLDPDLFAVKVHLHSSSLGGRDHVRALLSDESALPVGEILWTP
jgi:hypothetical protein